MGETMPWAIGSYFGYVWVVISGKRNSECRIHDLTLHPQVLTVELVIEGDGFGRQRSCPGDFPSLIARMTYEQVAQR